MTITKAANNKIEATGNKLGGFSVAGTPAVWNKKTSKGKVLIACKDKDQAKEVLKKLETVKDGGEIWI
jgi:hypothetical protein